MILYINFKVIAIIADTVDRESFDVKRNEIQVKMNRLKNKVSAHEKADNSFDETVLGLLDIATQAGNIFDKSNNLELKRLLLKFVFESLTLTEGKLTYKLRFPFNEFVDNNILMKQVVKSHEPNQHLINQYLHGNDNENLQIGCLKSLELAESQKNVRLAKNFASLLQIGDPSGTRTRVTAVRGRCPRPLDDGTAYKSQNVIIYNFITCKQFFLSL